MGHQGYSKTVLVPNTSSEEHFCSDVCITVAEPRYFLPKAGLNSATGPSLQMRTPVLEHELLQAPGSLAAARLTALVDRRAESASVRSEALPVPADNRRRSDSHEMAAVL
jgi:hypothetical protein